MLRRLSRLGDEGLITSTALRSRSSSAANFSSRFTVILSRKSLFGMEGGTTCLSLPPELATIASDPYLLPAASAAKRKGGWHQYQLWERRSRFRQRLTPKMFDLRSQHPVLVLQFFHFSLEAKIGSLHGGDLFFRIFKTCSISELRCHRRHPANREPHHTNKA